MKLAGRFPVVLLLAIAAATEVRGDSQDSIRAARERLSAAQRRGDAAQVLESYADDVILLPPDEEPVSGKPAVGRWLEAAARTAEPPSNVTFETLSLEVEGNAASEIGEQVFGDATAGNSRPVVRVRHLTIWRRQPDGSWKIARDMWNRAIGPHPRRTPAPAAEAAPPPRPAPETAPVPAPAPASVPAPPAVFAAPANREQLLPIPDPRRLGEAYIRVIEEKLHSRARKIRSLEAAPSAPERDARLDALEKEAAHYLETTIRDIGWIDLHRFSIEGACDAAWIVEKSGDRRLMESALPLMEKDLKNSAGSECYAGALKAYVGLAPKN